MLMEELPSMRQFPAIDGGHEVKVFNTLSLLASDDVLGHLGKISVDVQPREWGAWG